MDEIKMDGLSWDDMPELPPLPEINDTADSTADAQEAAPAAPEAEDIITEAPDYDLEDIDVSSLISDMDGNAIADAAADVHNMNPDKLYVSKENRFHSMQAEQEKKAQEEAERRQQEAMDKAIAKENLGVAQQYRQHSASDYSNNNVGSYRYNENGTNKSLDSLYEQQFQVNEELAQKGKNKAELISTIGMIYYGLIAIIRLITFITLPGIITFIPVAYNALLVYCLFRFRGGSRKAREILGWLCSISCIRGVMGLGTVIFGAGALSGIVGAGSSFMMVLEALFSIGVSGWLAFMFFADDDIAEYTKMSKESGVDIDSSFFNFRR